MDDLAEFDRPLFKKLTMTDTGSGSSNQGGFLVPEALDPYFPDLTAKLAATVAPTVDEKIRAVLFVGDTPKGVVTTRYQYQTRSGKRSPERRITDNLIPLFTGAKADDILLIERSTNDSKLYRLRLVGTGAPGYAELQAKTTGRKWGPLDPRDPPVTEKAVETAVAEQVAHEQSPLALFDTAAPFTEKWSKAVARSRAFQQRVTELYAFRCAVCGGGLKSPSNLFEIEAAHIVPRRLKGADDARNGLALCRAHHWAFDYGLFGVNPQGRIMIPAKVLDMAENTPLAPFNTQPLVAPSNAALTPAPHAFAWHMENVVSLNL